MECTNYNTVDLRRELRIEVNCSNEFENGRCQQQQLTVMIMTRICKPKIYLNMCRIRWLWLAEDCIRR